jgi:hypothetical protein
MLGANGCQGGLNNGTYICLHIGELPEPPNENNGENNEKF